MHLLGCASIKIVNVHIFVRLATWGEVGIYIFKVWLNIVLRCLKEPHCVCVVL